MFHFCFISNTSDVVDVINTHLSEKCSVKPEFTGQFKIEEETDPELFLNMN